MYEDQLTVVNGSYRRDGFTQEALIAESERLKKEHDIKTVTHLFIPNDLMSCIHCKKGCEPYCKQNDSFHFYISTIESSERVLFGSPVYLDMPSAKMVAFLTRLNCMAENTKREFFRGKKAHFLSVGYCSGTKTVIRTMMGACEMLGFTMEGRCSKEYIIKWNDKKIRGGMGNEKPIFIK